MIPVRTGTDYYQSKNRNTERNPQWHHLARPGERLPFGAIRFIIAFDCVLTSQ